MSAIRQVFRILLARFDFEKSALCRGCLGCHITYNRTTIHSTIRIRIFVLRFAVSSARPIARFDVIVSRRFWSCDGSAWTRKSFTRKFNPTKSALLLISLTVRLADLLPETQIPAKATFTFPHSHQLIRNTIRKLEMLWKCSENRNHPAVNEHPMMQWRSKRWSHRPRISSK